MAATTALTASSVGLNLFAGIMGMSAADAEASSLRSQARLLQTESEADIARYARETETFKAEQAMRYMKSGVTMDGSPLAILDETARVASENISAMRAKTSAQAQAMRSRGASGVAASRVAFLGNLASAGATVATTGEKLGWFVRQPKATSDTKGTK